MREDGRVLKKYNSPLVAYLKMTKDCILRNPQMLIHIPRYYRECRREAVSSLREVAKTSIDPNMIGNPTIIHDLDYVQDYVTPLRKYLVGANLTQGQIVIDNFVHFNVELAKKRFIDRTFKIMDNYGIGSNGQIVLVDLGEIVTDAERISAVLRERPWEKLPAGGSLPKHLRTYFNKHMGDALLPLSQHSDE